MPEPETLVLNEAYLFSGPVREVHFVALNLFFKMIVKIDGQLGSHPCNPRVTTTYICSGGKVIFHMVSRTQHPTLSVTCLSALVARDYVATRPC